MIEENDLIEGLEILVSLCAGDIPLLAGSVQHIMEYSGNYISDSVAEDGNTYLSNILDRLGDYESMQTLVEALGDIKGSIDALTCFCDALTAQQTAIIAQSTIIQVANNPNVTEDTVTVEDFSEEDAEKCQRAQAVADMSLAFCRNVIGYATGTGAISAPVLVALIAVLVPVAIPVEIIVAFMCSMAVFVFGAGLDVLMDTAEANKRVLVCALYNASTPLEAYQNACDAIDELNIGVVGSLLKLFYTERPLSYFYANADPEGYGTSCIDCVLGEGCVDFTDASWELSGDYCEVTEEGWLHITGSGTGLPELGARVWTTDADNLNLSFEAKGSLNEAHYPFVVYFTAHDVSNNVVDTDQYYALRYDTNWFEFEGELSGQNINHVHVSIRGVSGTQAWIKYMCVSE